MASHVGPMLAMAPCSVYIMNTKLTVMATQ